MYITVTLSMSAFRYVCAVTTPDVGLYRPSNLTYIHAQTPTMYVMYVFRKISMTT